MDVVWLKRDVRLHDHAPLARAFSSGRPVLLLYLYEPSQLSHTTVHGSHVHFANEGLLDVERQLNALTGDRTRHCITIRQGEMVDVLAELHRYRGVARLLAHQETGTYASFERDKAVRRWCSSNRVSFEEPPCNGVVRCLRERDQFSKHYNSYMTKPEAKVPSADSIRRHLIRGLPSVGIRSPRQLEAILEDHRGDRDRQRGGEQRALAVLADFLAHRGERYNVHISALGTAWSSCSRLSPYLAFGHISVKRVTLELNRVRAERRGAGGPWSKALAAFYSRVRWRAHFIQKLESQPEAEFRAMCAPLDKVRTEPGDWCERRYQAWCAGRTGYPYIDACMRCLLKHGWCNFRGRAMLVSFACYNLWLDWRRIASHLARCFLDYEPGIHYPQLQMQAGVSGINAMRVYYPTKQSKDHDKLGNTIRRFVPELANVPTEHIHEPWKMPRNIQLASGILVACDEDEDELAFAARHKLKLYPKPLVCEASSAKKAKEILSSMRKKKETRAAAADVLERHGSRMNREKRPYVADPKQTTFPVAAQRQPKLRKVDNSASPQKSSHESGSRSTAVQPDVEDGAKQKSVKLMLARHAGKSWSCKACTLLNEQVNAKKCRLCKTPR